MGTLADLHRKGRMGARTTNRNPLRKIVKYSHGYETLECGHAQRPRRDFIGETNATRRRCKRCGAKEAERASREDCLRCGYTITSENPSGECPKCYRPGCQECCIDFGNGICDECEDTDD